MEPARDRVLGASAQPSIDEQGFAFAPHLEERGGKMAERAVEAGLQLDRPLEAGSRLSWTAAEQQGHAEVVVSVRIVRVDLRNFVEQRNRLGPPSGVEVLLACKKQRPQPTP
jgi:hypothetical protein